MPWRDGEGVVTGVAAFFIDVSDPQRRALLLHAMEAIGQSLTSSLDLNEVLDTIVGQGARGHGRRVGDGGPGRRGTRPSIA